MSLIVGHPTGNANSRAAISGFYDAGLLVEFHTAIAAFPGSFLDKISYIKALSEIRRRAFDQKLSSVTKTHLLKETIRLLATKIGFEGLIKHETGLFSVDAVYRYIDQKVSSALNKRSFSGVYAYEDAALASFQKAKNKGINCYYDLPIGYWKAARKLLEGERSANPEWASTLTGFNDSPKKLARKDQELAWADHIFVASTFTKNTLNEYEGTLPPIEVIPYGFPAVTEEKDYRRLGKRPLKLLFVGGLSQRKGLAQMFEAVTPLGKSLELTVVGQKTGANCPVLDQKLALHRWIPSLPHSAILKQMREHDVLVFPSLFEGFGMVISEAMSQGTPVITTERTAGPDLIRHGENGWLVPSGSSSAIQAILEELLEQPQKVAIAGKAAMETARSRPWELYGQELATAVTQLIK